MNRDITPIVRAWLDDTISSAPPPVTLDRAVAAAVQRTPQRHGWRQRLRTGWSVPTYDATRLVVSGAIVALVGGVLLAAVLTTQQSVERSTVGASPSPSPQTTDDVLSRLETEEVAPGIMRIVGDWAGRDPSRVLSSIVTDDGSVWVATSASIYEITETARQPVGNPSSGWFLDLAADGTLWAASAASIRSHDGEAWPELGPTTRDPSSEPHPSWPADYIVDFAVHPDGTPWQTPEKLGDNEWNSVQHLGPNGWVTEAIGKGLPSPRACTHCGGYGDWSVEITPDGTVWLGTDRHGLMRRDGDAWEAVSLLGDDRPYGVISLEASRDGVLWAEVQGDDAVEWGLARLGEGRFLARFDGEDWDLFSGLPDPGPRSAHDSEYRGPSGIKAVAPDGTVWLSDRDPQAGPYVGRFPVSFDGERWRRYPEILAHWEADPRHDPDMSPYEMGRWHISVAPDGAAWANVDARGGKNSRGGVYVIRPEEVAPTE